jgi:hypothetical protein
VFASARAALEAMCCGCAVIVCDERGFCGMVTPDNFAALRAMNFGLRSLTQPVTVGRCLDEIARYDRNGAARVAESARNAADLNASLDRYVALYREVISGARRPVVDGAARKRAETGFLHHYLPRGVADPRWLWPAERDALMQKIDMLTKERDALRLALAEREAGDEFVTISVLPGKGSAG